MKFRLRESVQKKAELKSEKTRPLFFQTLSCPRAPRPMNADAHMTFDDVLGALDALDDDDHSSAQASSGQAPLSLDDILAPNVVQSGTSTSMNQESLLHDDPRHFPGDEGAAQGAGA